MQKLKLSVSGIFHICWTVFFGLLFMIVFSRLQIRSALKTLPFVAFFVLLLCFGRLRDGLNSMTDRGFRTVVISFVVLEAALFFAFAREMCVMPFTDTGIIWFSAADIAETGSLSPIFDEYCNLVGAHSSRLEYFLIYPNSRFLVSFLLPYCRLLINVFGLNLRSTAGYLASAVLNIIFILLTELILVFSARKIGGKSCGILMCLFCLPFFPYCIHAFKLYSDTMSMPFVALTVYLVISAEAAESRSQACHLLLLAGISAGLGFLLKGSVIVLGVAVLLYLLFGGIDRSRKLVGIAAFVAALASVCLFWAIRSERLPWLDTAESDRYEMPAIHWIMMASEGDGGFSLDDYEYSQSFDTLEKRKAADWSEYQRRVQNWGIAGYLQFCAEKIAAALSDGLYYQRNHLDYLKEIRLYHFLCSHPLESFCDLFVCLFYIGFLLSGCLGIHKDNGILFLCNICFFGVILFFSLWECKSRYLLNYTPVFLLSTVLVTERFSSPRCKLQPKPAELEQSNT